MREVRLEQLEKQRLLRVRQPQLRGRVGDERALAPTDHLDSRRGCGALEAVELQKVVYDSERKLPR
jgi:hypothetical protein